MYKAQTKGKSKTKWKSVFNAKQTNAHTLTIGNENKSAHKTTKLNYW